MMAISSNNVDKAVGQWGKRGYSLLETMVALAIMSISVAFIMPKAAGALDQVVVHTVQFDLQRQLTGFRQRAFASNSALVLVPAGAQPGIVSSRIANFDDAVPVQVTLRSGWTYRLNQPLFIGPDSRCSPATLDLFDKGRPSMHLEGGADCILIRKAN
jgi:prepilin-type N-terminal cleavage/methylation domain-containing protein